MTDQELMIFGSKKRRLLILAPFIIAIAMWWVYSQIITPLPYYTFADPEIPYFISSLSVFKGEPYTFIDHPGTPVEMIGTLVLGLVFLFSGEPVDSFIMSQVLHPETFLLIVRTILVGLSLLTMVLLTLTTVPGDHWTDGLAAVSLAILFFAVHPKGFEYIVHWSHNSFNFPLGTLLGLGLYWLLIYRRGGSTAQKVLIGFSFGILTAIQLYFLTWVVAAIVAILVNDLLNEQGWRTSLFDGLRLGVGAVGGFVLATIPIVNRYPDFLAWIVRVSTHQGRHGEGPVGFMSVDSLVTNFTYLWGELRLLLLSMAFLTIAVLVFLVWGRGSIKKAPGIWAAGVGFSIQVILMSLLIIKHPGVIYMQAIAAAMPLMLAVIFALIPMTPLHGRPVERLGKFGSSLLIISVFLFNYVGAFLFQNAQVRHVKTAQKAIGDFVDGQFQERGVERSSISILQVYGMPSKCLVLWYGNQYADYALAREVGSVCPNELFLDLWEAKVVRPDGTSVDVTQLDWDLLIAFEAALIDFPYLTDLGEVVYDEARLGTFGRILYVLPFEES